MKHIKNFEDINNYIKYDVGDYVLISNMWFVDNKYRMCKIIKIFNNTIAIGYDVLLINNKTLWVSEDMIIRKLTDKEIEKYNIDINLNIYNL